MAEEERLERLSANNPLKICGKCKCDFKERVPKLLPCLHTVCEACLTNKNNGDTTPVVEQTTVEPGDGPEPGAPDADKSGISAIKSHLYI